MTTTPTPTPAPHPAPATDVHAGGIVVGLAALEGVVYSIFVYLNASFTVWSSSFYPSVGNGEMIAIRSTIYSVLFIWVLAWIHTALQRKLCQYGSKPSGWFFALDLITSVAPCAALVIAWLVDISNRPAGGYYSWALAYLTFISLVVAGSVHEDLRALLRYKR